MTSTCHFSVTGENVPPGSIVAELCDTTVVRWAHGASIPEMWNGKRLLRGKGNSLSKVLAGDGSTASGDTSAGHRPTLMCGGLLHFRRGPRKIRTACLSRSEAESSTSGLTNACTGVAGPGGFKWMHSWRPPGDARSLCGQIENRKGGPLRQNPN